MTADDRDGLLALIDGLRTELDGLALDVVSGRIERVRDYHSEGGPQSIRTHARLIDRALDGVACEGREAPCPTH